MSPNLNSTARIVSIAHKSAGIEPKPETHFARVPVERAMLLVGHGIAGDVKGRHDSRQLNVMLAETVEQLRREGFRTAPGELGEQIVIAGVPINDAIPGVRLQIGPSAVIELVYARVPCGRFARIQGHPKDAARNRIGFMAKVICGGEIAVGSPVVLEQPPAPALSCQSLTG